MSSDNFKQQILALSSSNAFFYLFEIDHVDLTTPFRIVNNTQSITSNGIVYEPLAFTLVLPNKADDIPKSKLVIDNVDRQIYDVIDAIEGELTGSVSLIMSSDPDTVELGPIEFKITNVTFDKNRASFDLTFEDNLSLKYPAFDFTPNLFPGLF